MGAAQSSLGLGANACAPSTSNCGAGIAAGYPTHASSALGRSFGQYVEVKKTPGAGGSGPTIDLIPSTQEASGSAAPAEEGASTAAAPQAAVSGFAAAALSKETDYMELPQPVRYEELQKECLMSLRPETFEGMRFDFTKPLNQR